MYTIRHGPSLVNNMKPATGTPRVVVVGAGVGGLIAAIECASRGLRVSLLERAPHPGGKLRAECPGGRATDAGPTVFTWPEVIDETLARAGTRLDEHLGLRRLDVLARHFWEDGSRLDLFADRDRAAAAIADWSSPAEADRYRTFCDETAAMFEALEQPFMRHPRGSAPALSWRMARSNPKGLALIQPFATLWDTLTRRFRDPRLVQLFGRYATYCGSSPFLAPATLMLIAHVEARGVWVVEDGLYRLADALAEVACAQGVALETAAEVSRLQVQGGRVRGVVLGDGRVLAADAVVFNGDAAALAQGRLGAEARRAGTPMPAARRSLSALTWHLQADAGAAPLSYHNVFFAPDSEREFDALFAARKVPSDGTVYVCAPDRVGEAIAAQSDEPAERGAGERLMCLINAPADGDQVPPPGRESAAREAIVERLAACSVTIRPVADTDVFTTPAHFERRFPATGGALYGRVSHGWRASFERPGARTAIAGLYQSGGSAHPGAGVPMAALSGRLAAEALFEDFRV